jgi:hypothetical protein
MADSYADVLCPGIPLTTDCLRPKAQGDLVRVGANVGPVFEIVAIDSDTAWVREPVTFRGEALVPLARLRAAS